MIRLGLVLGLGVLASGCSNVTSAAYNRGLWYGRDDQAAVFYCPPDGSSTCYRARFVKAFPSDVDGAAVDEILEDDGPRRF